MKLRERVIDLSARIAVLRSEIDGKRAELLAMEKELDAMLVQRPEPVSQANSDQMQWDEVPPLKNGHASIADRIKKLLSENAPIEVSTEVIQVTLGDVNLPSVRAALSRLTNEEIIERVGRGIYRAKAA